MALPLSADGAEAQAFYDPIDHQKMRFSLRHDPEQRGRDGLSSVSEIQPLMILLLGKPKAMRSPIESAHESRRWPPPGRSNLPCPAQKNLWRNGGCSGKLDEFRAFFDAFARQKSRAPSDHRWLVAACKARQLTLTSASQNGEALVWHAYVMCGKTATLQYTCSCFRNRESDYRALVGRVNRWLHWRDMLRFEEMGMEHYGWGACSRMNPRRTAVLAQREAASTGPGLLSGLRPRRVDQSCGCPA